MYPEILSHYHLPFVDLINQAQTVHRNNFNPNEIKVSTLLNFKTGACPENCSYCNQSAHYDTGLTKERMMNKEEILAAAIKAKEHGATRFCLAAAWRGPHDRDLPFLQDIIHELKVMGLETCMSLGLLKEGQAESLKDAGLDYYNHNIDTSEDYYQKIITTRTFADRMDTLSKVREAGIKVCTGGILGLGETIEDRLKMLQTLAEMNPQPESITINSLIPIEGTPLGANVNASVDSFAFVRMVAVTRIFIPKAYIRLSAGRASFSDETQALAILAGANSIHFGEKLLTTDNVLPERDLAFFQKLSLTAV